MYLRQKFLEQILFINLEKLYHIMALSEDTAIYRTAYRLLLQSQPIVAQMPRTYRYDLGQRITNTLLDILTLIIEANRAHDKREALRRLQVKHEILAMLYNVGVDLQAISRRHLATLLPLIDSIGKQATGWNKSLQKAPQ